LEGFHAEDFFNLVVKALVLDEARIDNDLVHQALHDLFIFLLVKILLVGSGFLQRWHVVAGSIFLDNSLDLFLVLFALISS